MIGSLYLIYNFIRQMVAAEGERNRRYHILPQSGPENVAGHQLDEIAMIALTSILNFGLAAILPSEEHSRFLDYVGVIHQTAMFMILFSTMTLGRIFPTWGYTIDRLGVALVFGSLFYASGPGLCPEVLAFLLLLPHAVAWARYYYVTRA